MHSHFAHFVVVCGFLCLITLVFLQLAQEYWMPCNFVCVPMNEGGNLVSIEGWFIGRCLCEWISYCSTIACSSKKNSKKNAQIIKI